MQSELFRIPQPRLFWAARIAAFFVFALALTLLSQFGKMVMLPVISLVSFTEFLFQITV